jgi:hypothetical protein
MPPRAGNGEIVVALYDYAAAEDGDLAFSKGDRIRVTGKDGYIGNENNNFFFFFFSIRKIIKIRQ